MIICPTRSLLSVIFTKGANYSTFLFNNNANFLPISWNVLHMSGMSGIVILQAVFRPKKEFSYYCLILVVFMNCKMILSWVLGPKI